MSEPLFRMHRRLLAEARALISACPCREGCPSCTGPGGEAGHRAKEVALAILDAIHGRGDGDGNGNGAPGARRSQGG